MHQVEKVENQFLVFEQCAFLSHSQSNATGPNIVWSLNFSDSLCWNCCRNPRYWFWTNITIKVHCFINHHPLSPGCWFDIVSVLHQHDPRDFPRASPSGNLLGLGKSLRRQGWIFQHLPSFGGVWKFSSSSSHLQGWIRKSIPLGREWLTVFKSILPCQWECTILKMWVLLTES